MRATAVSAILTPALAVPTRVVAEQTAATSAAAVSPLTGGALLETTVGLLLVLALILGLGWVVRRYGKLPLAGKGLVSILGGVSLGPRERAVLLQVGETRLLVGVAPGRVQTLHVLQQGAAPETDFSAQLNGQIRQDAK